MLKRTGPFTCFALGLIFSLAAALFGAGLGYSRQGVSFSELSRFTGFFEDGWIRDQAAAGFKYLARRGNRLEMSFSARRPRGAGTQNLSVSVCQEPPQVFTLSSGGRIAVSLNGRCAIRTVRFITDNPYVPSQKDQRKLIAQISSAGITSRLGIPILDPLFILTAGSLIFVLGMLAYHNVPTWKKGAAASAILASFFLLTRAGTADYTNLLYLWGLTCLILLGGILADRVRRETNRHASSARIFLLSALALTALGALLRFYALDFGLPDNYHPDETPKANAIMRMYDSGTLNPHYFLHPSLLLYCTYFTNTVFHFFGMQGEFRASAFLAGRTVSAVAGSLSILLLYFAGARLFSRKTGLYAAALLAFFPLHVTCSRYLKEDALLVFFTLACLCSVLKAVQEKKYFYIYLAAVLAGLSASTKYTGLLNSVILLYSPWLSSGSIKPDRTVLKHVLLSIPLVPLAFFCASPYSVLNSAKFLSDFRYEKKHMLKGHTNVIDAWSQFWMFHWSHSIIPGMTAPVAAAGAIGLGALLFRPSTRNLLMVMMVLVYYLPSEWVRAKPFPQPDRYILPILPFLALAVSYLLHRLDMAERKLTAACLGLILFVFPCGRSLELARDIKHDTRRQAEAWLVNAVPADSFILMEWQPYSPFLRRTALKHDFILRENILERLRPDWLGNSGADYLIVSNLFYGRYFDRAVNDPLFRGRFEWAFRNLPVVKQFAAPSGSYGFHNPLLTVFSLKEMPHTRTAEK